MKKNCWFFLYLAQLIFLPIGPLQADSTLQLGIDVLEQSNFALLKGKKIGILTHNAARDSNNVPIYEAFYRSPVKDQIVCIFTPEHGLLGQYAAAKKVPNECWQGIPVISLYNNDQEMPPWSPTESQLRPIDTLVIDLVDIGARCYTYITCMRFALEQCIRYGKEVVILDRPNPLGRKISGPFMDEKLQSYVGGFCIPFLHGMTMGELARMVLLDYRPHPWLLPLTPSQRQNASVTIVKMKNYRPNCLWDQQAWRKNVQWVPPSPNIPTFASALGYSCTLAYLLCDHLKTVLTAQLETKNGKVQPFRFLYSPHTQHNPYVICKHLNDFNLPGITFEVLRHKDIQGISSRFVNWESFDPGLFLLKLFQLDQQLAPIDPPIEMSYLLLNTWRPRQNFSYQSPFIAKGPVRHHKIFWKIHIGDSHLIDLIESRSYSDAAIKEQVHLWNQAIESFERQRKAWLLY